MSLGLPVELGGDISKGGNCLSCSTGRLCGPGPLTQSTGFLHPQIPAAAFSLVTKDGQPVGYDMEVPDSGIDLQCTLAPDGSFAWSWRVKHGQLENRP